MRRRRRADGRLRQLRRVPAHHRVRRRAVELVRPPQPRSLLGRRQARRRKSSTPTGRCTSAWSRRPSSSPRSCRSSPKRCGRILREARLASASSERRQKAFTSATIPTGDAAVIDEALSERMNLVRLIASLGRNARNAAALKVRQPLAKVEVILADTTHQAWLEEHADVIDEELNVKQLEFCDDPSQYVEHEVVPNFKLLGPKLGKLLPKVKQWLGQQTGAELLANIRDNGQIDLDARRPGDRARRAKKSKSAFRPKPGWAVGQGSRACVVVLVHGADAGADRRRPGPRRRAADSGSPQGNRLRIHRSHRNRLGHRRRPSWRRRSNSSATTSRRKRWRRRSSLEPLPGVEPVDVKVLGARFDDLSCES